MKLKLFSILLIACCFINVMHGADDEMAVSIKARQLFSLKSLVEQKIMHRDPKDLPPRRGYKYPQKSFIPQRSIPYSRKHPRKQENPKKKLISNFFDEDEIDFCPLSASDLEEMSFSIKEHRIFTAIDALEKKIVAEEKSLNSDTMFLKAQLITLKKDYLDLLYSFPLVSSNPIKPILSTHRDPKDLRPRRGYKYPQKSFIPQQLIPYSRERPRKQENPEKITHPKTTGLL